MRACLLKIACLVVASVVGATACGPDGGKTESEVEIYLNELMPSNQTALADPAGEFDDWLELYNPGGKAVDLEGFFISDDPADLRKETLAAGLEVPAKGFLVIWADGDPAQGNDHLGFKLSASGEDLILTDPEGKQVDAVRWDYATADHSWARYPDGGEELSLCQHSTPGASNGSSCVE